MIEPSSPIRLACLSKWTCSKRHIYEHPATLPLGREKDSKYDEGRTSKKHLTLGGLWTSLALVGLL
jgi:hypothetical protein